MPFKSQSQRALFYSRPDLHKYIPEYEQATKGKLPERIKPKLTRKQKLKQDIHKANPKKESLKK